MTRSASKANEAKLQSGFKRQGRMDLDELIYSDIRHNCLSKKEDINTKRHIFSRIVRFIPRKLFSSGKRPARLEWSNAIEARVIIRASLLRLRASYRIRYVSHGAGMAGKVHGYWETLD